jgi:hypothetical protein
MEFIIPETPPLPKGNKMTSVKSKNTKKLQVERKPQYYSGIAVALELIMRKSNAL